MIGDPHRRFAKHARRSGREQVDANARPYLAQVFKILDPAKTEVRYQQRWLRQT